MTDFPSVKQDGLAIYVTLGLNLDTSTRKTCEFVLDYDAMGTVIGIEIINLKLQVGPNSLGAIERTFQSPSSGMQYSYYDDCDCFYLEFARERSLDQKAVDGIVALNDAGEIVALSADAIT